MPEQRETDAEVCRSPVVRGALWLVRRYMSAHHRLRVLSPCTLPADGPAILVCNHISGLDPAVLQASSHRMITWMMAKEYYDIRGMRWFYEAVRAIPVERSGRDLAATRVAMRTLASGRVLGIFPEGRIADDGRLGRFQTGVALMAIKAGVPVYPAYIDGTTRGTGMVEAFLYPQSVGLMFGSPVRFDRSQAGREAIELATAEIRWAVMRLAEEMASRVTGDGAAGPVLAKTYVTR